MNLVFVDEAFQRPLGSKFDNKAHFFLFSLELGLVFELVGIHVDFSGLVDPLAIAMPACAVHEDYLG